MLQRPPRVAAIHDLSGFGRCSLTVILPVLSAMKVQVCPVVTAVLSTHTGGLGDVVVQDLTGMLKPTLEHYKRLGIGFECVYSGWLGSEEQVGLCLDYFKAWPDALAVVDPVMGDHGKPYRTSTGAMIAQMGRALAGLERSALTRNAEKAAQLRPLIAQLQQMKEEWAHADHKRN